MVQYRVKNGTISNDGMGYEPGDIIEDTTGKFDTANNVEKVDCPGCSYHKIGSGGKGHCEKFADEDHRDCVAHPFK